MPIKTPLPYKYNITFLAVSQDYVKSKLKINIFSPIVSVADTSLIREKQELGSL